MNGRVAKFSRERDQRRALLKALAGSLILHETMTTTHAKAKAVAQYVERLVRFAKQDTLANRRLVRSRLSTDIAVKKLFEELAPAWKDRQGGYTRVIHAGNRGGDNAPVSVVSLVLPEGLQVAPEAPKAAAKSDAPKNTTAPKKTVKKAAAKPKAKAKAGVK